MSTTATHSNVPTDLWQRVFRWLKRLALAGLLLLGVFLVLDWLMPLPMEDFEHRRFAQVVVDRSGQPLRTFADKQGIWRYPVNMDEVSPYYIEALINYEDRYFYQHFGVNPLAVMRALYQRITTGRFVSGASTLTMQVARILQPHERTFSGKLTQMFRALQLEWHYSKTEILNFYLNYAPFGGPIEGVQAASYVYLGKPANQLSHSEAALLAVLPQAPSRYRPDRHKKLAKAARDKVLDRMFEQQVWSEQVVREAKEEPVWASYQTHPMVAPLLARRLSLSYPQHSVIRSTIDRGLQSNLEQMLQRHIEGQDEQVSAAIMVVNNADMSALAYLGSADFLNEKRHGFVDMITATRSPGSTLKPFIYGLAIDQGIIHDQSLLFDVPHSFAGYRPKNFSDDFSGPVSVSQALVRSLNMPAVQVLEHLTPETFYINLKNAGLNIRLPEQAKPNLSLALGGGGVTMEQLVGVFASLGNQGKAGIIRYTPTSVHNSYPLLSEGAAWIIQHTLAQGSLNNRLNQRQIKKSPGIAFKTGTSYGFRDAWALASTAEVTIGVWVGQPDGSFLPENSGREAAVPLLNQVLAIIPSQWHRASEQPMAVTENMICWPMGLQARLQTTEACQQKRSAYLLDGMAPQTLSDPMNQMYATERLSLLLDSKTGLRVTPDCAIGETVVESQVVWPMVLDPWLPHHQRRQQLLPAFYPDCLLMQSDNQLAITGIHDQAIIYPEVTDTTLPEIALELVGSTGINYWFLNGHLLEQYDSQLILRNLPAGEYELQAIDSSAQTASLNFVVRM